MNERQTIFRHESIILRNHEKDKMNARKQLIQRTLSIEQMLTSIIEHSNEIFYFHDTHHKFIYVSPQSFQILGYTPDEMMIEWTRLVTDNPINKIGYEITAKALATGQRQKPYLLEVFKKDGRKVLLEIEESPLQDEEGKVIGIIGAARDVTESKKVEEILQASEERFRALTENTSDWIWEVDKSFVYTYASPKVKDLLGYEPNDVIGKTPFDFMPEREARRISEISHSILAAHKPFKSLENINLHKDGREIILETSGIPIFDKNGNFSGYRGIDRDITERKQARESLKQKEVELEIKARNLEEVNTALKVLLKKREEDKIELEEKVLLNIKELVLPYLEKIEKGGLDKNQRAYADILEAHLKEIISPFSYRLSSAYVNLTPAEINVANLVKQGKTNKEIAALLNVSTRTAAFHREHIRQKLGIKNKKTNLKSYLSSIN
jgi:PAS domain S-box-containing protein